MDSIRLKNGSEYPIDDGAMFQKIVHRAASAIDAAGFAGGLPAENLEEVDFVHDGVVNGHYEDLSPQYATIDEGVVTFGLEET